MSATGERYLWVVGAMRMIDSKGWVVIHRCWRVVAIWGAQDVLFHHERCGIRVVVKRR